MKPRNLILSLCSGTPLGDKCGPQKSYMPITQQRL